MRSPTLLMLVALIIGTLACSESHSIRIGAKDFAEQRVLAEMAAQVLRDDGFAVESVVSCGDTYECYGALQAGELDVLIDYTGTGFVFRGATPSGGEDGLRRLQQLYAPIGLNWLSPLGFDNGYILVASGDLASRTSSARISDLAALEEGVRFACPREFLRRPLDGLQSLLQRYGLRMRREPLVEETPGERVAAVLDGRAEIAVLYGTDWAVEDTRLQVLEDDLGFFPEYRAAFVVRLQTQAQSEGLARSLARLEGQVSRESMRRLNRAVQLEGASAHSTAAFFLVESGLLGSSDGAVARSPDLVIATQMEGHLEPFANRALTAVRGAYPRRTVVVRKVGSAVASTCSGEVRLALLGAERFFDTGTRDESIEAVVAVGSRTLHYICRLEVADESLAQTGIPPVGSGGGIAASQVLSGRELVPSDSDQNGVLLSRAERGELDCVLLLVETGDPEVGAFLSRGVLGLRDLDAADLDIRHAAPYLRPARIPAGTYDGQSDAIESFGSQVLLVGPRRARGALEATGGPATALPASGQPVPAERVQAMAEVSTFYEAPSPVLPSAWERSLSQRPSGRTSGGPLDAILNGLVFLFLVWLVYLVFRRERNC